MRVVNSLRQFERAFHVARMRMENMGKGGASSGAISGRRPPQRTRPGVSGSEHSGRSDRQPHRPPGRSARPVQGQQPFRLRGTTGIKERAYSMSFARRGGVGRPKPGQGGERSEPRRGERAADRWGERARIDARQPVGCSKRRSQLERLNCKWWWRWP